MHVITNINFKIQSKIMNITRSELANKQKNIPNSGFLLVLSDLSYRYSTDKDNIFAFNLQQEESYGMQQGDELIEL